MALEAVLIWIGTTVVALVVMAAGIRHDMKKMPDPPTGKVAKAVWKHLRQ